MLPTPQEVVEYFFICQSLILQLAGANFYHLQVRSPERIKELHIYLLA
ncbi:hypothetical protein [Nostoc sp.]